MASNLCAFIFRSCMTFPADRLIIVHSYLPNSSGTPPGSTMALAMACPIYWLCLPHNLTAHYLGFIPQLLQEGWPEQQAQQTAMATKSILSKMEQVQWHLHLVFRKPATQCVLRRQPELTVTPSCHFHSEKGATFSVLRTHT